MGRPNPSAEPASFPRSDAGQAEYLAYHFGADLRFDHRRGVWLIWDGTRWVTDGDEAIRRLTIKAARLRQHAAIDARDEVRTVETRFSLSLEFRGRLLAVADIARSVPPIADSGAGWDADPRLLGVANGVVDLATGVLREGRREDRMTKSTGVPYDPAASCPRWHRFLSEVFAGEADVIRFVQRAVGYTLTGECREEVFFLAYGLGANGKTRFLGGLSSILGDYASTIPFAALEASAGRPSNDIAALVGKRFVASSETAVSSRFDEARLKSLTGRDKVAARFLYHETFEFQPVLKLWLGVNHLPVVTDNSLGLWRRVLVLPFPVTFSTHPEKDLDERLRAERHGILAWAIEGARLWYAEGWSLPAVVTAATERYRVESDTFARFLAEECVNAAGSMTAAAQLYYRYTGWAAAEGLPGWERLTQTAFGRLLRERFEKVKTNKGAFYKGIRLGNPHPSQRGPGND